MTPMPHVEPVRNGDPTNTTIENARAFFENRAHLIIVDMTTLPLVREAIEGRTTPTREALEDWVAIWMTEVPWVAFAAAVAAFETHVDWPRAMASIADLAASETPEARASRARSSSAAELAATLGRN